MLCRRLDNQPEDDDKEDEKHRQYRPPRQQGDYDYVCSGLQVITKIFTKYSIHSNHMILIYLLMKSNGASVSGSRE